MSVLSYPLARFLVLVCSLFLAACQAIVSESGNIIETDKADQIHIGQTHRDQVRELLGPPTLVNTFRQERWIYIQDRQFKNIQRTFSRVTNRIEITFDEQGLVRDIQKNFNDSLYDPRHSSRENEDRSYAKWLFGGEFSKPMTDPPKESESAAENSPSFWPRFLKKDSASETTSESSPASAVEPNESAPATTRDSGTSNLPEAPMAGTADPSEIQADRAMQEHEKNATEASETGKKSFWSFWPWGKKDEREEASTQTEQEATPGAPTEPRGENKPPVPTDADVMQGGKYQPAYTEELTPRTVRQPGMDGPPNDAPAAPKKVETRLEQPKPPSPGLPQAPWWRFWSR
ncbi:MAG: outer membrane protein assembly factor BamE [Magnetococcales bacterium]|nr:outer membrane protein assembly factor BamE [Magnetococcales bacterium]